MTIRSAFFLCPDVYIVYVRPFVIFLMMGDERTSLAGPAAFDIVLAHWLRNNATPTRRERYLKHYNSYFARFWNLTNDVVSGDHLADALRWFAGFCLGMSGHDFYDPSLHGVVSSSGRHCESADRGRIPRRRRTVDAIVALGVDCNHYRVPQVIPHPYGHGEDATLTWRQRFHSIFD